AKSGGSNWQDTWLLNDPYGTASELIPPSTTTKLSNDDSANAITPSPVTWHTSPESHARVYSYNPAIASDPSAVSWGSGRIDLFAVASDGNVWHRPFSGGAWGAWESWAAPAGISWASGIDASSWGSGHLDVFGAGNDGAVWHRAWDSATGFGAW